MQNDTMSATAGPPPIHLIDSEYDMIADFALGLVRQSPELAKMLLDEIDRAEIYPRETLPADVVSLGAEVDVLDETTGSMRHLRLVVPSEASIEAGRVSILTPMGAGLIGMRKGYSIAWPNSSGEARMLKIVEVRQLAG